MTKTKSKAVRCNKCGRFVCEIRMLDPKPHVGRLVEVAGIVCKKCGTVSSFTIAVMDRSDKKTVESEFRERVRAEAFLDGMMRVVRKRRCLPAPEER